MANKKLARKSPKELILEEIKSVDPQDQSFASAVKWCRSVVRFIKRKDNTRVEIELCLELLDSLIYDSLVKFVTFGHEGGEPVSEKERAAYVDIISIVEDIKSKYDDKMEREEAQSRLSDKLSDLEDFYREEE